MYWVKWFTQRVTMLICIALGLGLIPFVLSKFMELTGLLGGIDRLWDSNNQVGFWVVFIISRLVYAGFWILITFFVVKQGERRGFFWSKPGSPYHDQPSVDKSSEIVMWISIAVVAVVVSEFAIRIYTLTNPPFLSPPV